MRWDSRGDVEVCPEDKRGAFLLLYTEHNRTVKDGAYK